MKKFNPKLEKCIEYETKFNYEILIEDAINNIETIDINNEKSKYNF